MDPDYPKIYLYRRLVQAKLFIDSAYASPIDLDNISNEACFSKFHFIRLFSKIYGKTPHQYLTHVRIEKAKLLLQNRQPVADVCLQVGFDSVSSFTGLFKKNTGITPALYQQQQVKLQQQITEKPLQFIPHCFAQTRGWTKKSNFQEA